MRVVIADEEVLLREGLTLLLGANGISVVGSAGDVDGLLATVATHDPDLLITDIQLLPEQGDDGLQAALRLRAERPAMAVLLLSQQVQRCAAAQLLAAGRGGLGYLLKQRVSDAEQFCSDLRDLVAGGTVLDPEVVDVLVQNGARPALERLTERQREVLALVAEGRSNAAIAALLSISEKSVVGHVSNIYDALDLPPSADDHRRVLAVLQYLGS